MTITFSDIQAADAAVTGAKDAYLRRWGWDCTCSTPGALWMWTRDFSDVDAKRKAWDEKHGAGKPGSPSISRPYGLVMGSREQAIHMTLACLDEQPEMDDEEAA